MAVTIAAFRIKFRAFRDVAAFPNEDIDDKLQEALRYINVDHFGTLDKADDANYYLAAHLLEMSQPNRASGVQSVTAGQASVSYAAIDPLSRDGLSLTGYGLRYRGLVKLPGGARLL